MSDRTRFDNTKARMTEGYENGSDEFKKQVDQHLKNMEGTIIGEMIADLFGKAKKEAKEVDQGE